MSYYIAPSSSAAAATYYCCYHEPGWEVCHHLLLLILLHWCLNVYYIGITTLLLLTKYLHLKCNKKKPQDLTLSNNYYQWASYLTYTYFAYAKFNIYIELSQNSKMASKFVRGVICLKRARNSKNYAKIVRVGISVLLVTTLMLLCQSYVMSTGLMH